MTQSDPGHLADPRQQRILHALQARGEVRVMELAHDLAVTDETIRRDLKLLETRGALRRVHGGAVPATPARDVSFAQRMSENAPAKRAIARATLDLLGAARTLFIDEGSVTLPFAQLLAERRGLSIMTNMPAIADAVGGGDHEVMLTGGMLDRRNMFLRGEMPFAAARSRLFDLTVMGTSGIDPELGVLANDEEMAALRRLLAARSSRVVIATTHLQLGRRAPWCAFPLSAAHSIVTDKRPARTFCDAFAAAGTLLVVPGDNAVAAA